MRKRWLMVTLCAVFLAFAQVSQAATREEIAGIKVSAAGDFQYWSSSSPAKAALLQYVEDVTNEKSPDFIPEADRIAVFDVDGTLMCETAPSYFDEMMYLDRIFHDTSWQIPAILNAEKLFICRWLKSCPIWYRRISRFILYQAVTVRH